MNRIFWVILSVFLINCGSVSNVNKNRDKCLKGDCEAGETGKISGEKGKSGGLETETGNKTGEEGEKKKEEEGKEGTTEKKPEKIYKLDDFKKKGENLVGSLALRRLRGNNNMEIIVDTKAQSNSEFSFVVGDETVNNGNIHFPIKEGAKGDDYTKYAAAGNFPVILWFGSASLRYSAYYKNLINHWVSHGFIVVRRSFDRSMESDDYEKHVKQIVGMVKWIKDKSSKNNIINSIYKSMDTKNIFFAGHLLGAKHLLLAAQQAKIQGVFTFDLVDYEPSDEDRLTDKFKDGSDIPLTVWGPSSKKVDSENFKGFKNVLKNNYHYVEFDRFNPMCIASVNQGCSDKDRDNVSSSFIPLSTVFFKQIVERKYSNFFSKKALEELKKNTDISVSEVKGDIFTK